MFSCPTVRAVTPAFFAAVLCIWALATPSAAGKAAPFKNGEFSAPLFEQFFAQPFQVSVMTQSYGVFNATLRMHASLNFPERVLGELIPIGDPKLNSQRQTLLPHFQRARDVEDEKLSHLPFSMAAGLGSAKSPRKGGADESGSREFAVPGIKERPSLLMVDLHLQHSDAMQGTASVFYLPAELMALRALREGMREGSMPPSATVAFEFRPEVEHMTGNPLSDVNALAHVSHAIVTMGGQGNAHKSSSAVSEEGDKASGVATGQGAIIFRWITEHEFSAHMVIPIANKAGTTSMRMERVWVYGYTTPSRSVFDRKQPELPWYNKYMMIGAGLLGFVVQVISGIAEGKRRTQEAVKLEAQLLEQERRSTKKK
ncbi:hypothetical protein NXY56_005051 [Leishmania guyanensis]|uniref:Transmembrane protein n=1 Tax=Leishmania guyanensis TaxID=5670 RepID=A0A1E1J1U0_LEIGU|nr:hypothetical protein, conserved [Leishmania guyanensis]